MADEEIISPVDVYVNSVILEMMCHRFNILISKAKEEAKKRAILCQMYPLPSKEKSSIQKKLTDEQKILLQSLEEKKPINIEVFRKKKQESVIDTTENTNKTSQLDN